MRNAWLALVLFACTPARSLPREELAFDTADAEVWVHELVISGHAPRALQSCTLSIDSRQQSAQVQGQRFEARIAIAPEHESLVVARCSDAQGRPLGWSALRLRGLASARPTARAQARIEGDKLVLDGQASSVNTGTGAALESFVWRDESAPIANDVLATVPTPLTPGEHSYALHVRDAADKEDVSRVSVRVDAQGAHVLDRASWIETAVVYGVVPPLYGEPPLEKLTAALDSLQALGVDTLWLSPVFQSPADDFGYAVTDPFHVRPALGGDAALDTLIREAHARKLRVLLDLVINHSSAEHPYYRESEALGARSHYYSFYDRDADGEATHYFDWKHLPNYNFAYDEMAAWALAWSRQWIERGVDGYRVDAAWGVRQRSPSFYPRWSAELRRVQPSLLLLAEASARDPYYLEQGFDAAYDWSEELGHHAWEHVFDSADNIAERLSAQLAQPVSRPERTFRFLNNNDTGARFITRHGEPLTRVATAALLTLPGIPCLYALDELGAEYQPYEETPPTISERPGLRAFHKQLIALRRTSQALSGAAYRLLLSRGNTYVYLRGDAKNGALVMLNFGALPAEVELATPAELRGRVLHDALTSQTLALRGPQVSLTLPPWAVRIYVSE